MTSASRSPAPVVIQFSWHETRDSSGKPVRTGIESTYRRTVDMAWIPEAGERVHLSENGTAYALVDTLEWMVDGRPLVTLMGWESPDPPTWIERLGYVLHE